MEILRQNKNARDKNTVTEIKMPLTGLLVDSWGKNLWARKCAIKLWKAEKQREQWLQKEQNIQGLWENSARHSVHMLTQKKSKEGREKGTEQIFETIIPENFPQMSVSHHTTDPRANTGRINAKKYRTRSIILKLQVRDKQNTLKEPEGRNTSPKQDRG